MRTFAAFLLPDEIKDYAAGFKKELADLQIPVKWVARENYHLTVKFLGEINTVQMNHICRVLEATAAQYSSFSLSAGDLGVFPGRKRPRVIWLGMHGDEEQALDLMKKVDKRMMKLSYKQEDHKLHLTLGRTRQGMELEVASRLDTLDWDTHNQKRSTKFTVDSIYLMESHLSAAGPTYSILERFKLQPRAGD